MGLHVLWSGPSCSLAVELSQQEASLAIFFGNRFVVECHMYVVQQGERVPAGLQCTDGNSFLMSDQYVNPVGPTLVDMTPTSPYMKALSVCCGGCKPIEPANEVCTGPATPL